MPSQGPTQQPPQSQAGPISAVDLASVLRCVAPSLFALLRSQLMAIKVAAEHSCMLFQSAVLCNVVQQVVHNQATTQL